MLNLDIKLDGSVDWKLDWPAIRQEQARAGLVSLRDHFYSLGGETFWPGAAKSLESRVTDDGVQLLVMQKGVLLRWKGTEGYPPVVSPNGKLMAIPADKGNKTYPRHYGGTLKYIAVKGQPKLKAILVEAEERMSKKKIEGQYKMVVAAKKNAPVKYWLVSHTEHTPDPNVIDMDQLGEDIKKATTTIIKLTNRKKKGTP